MGHSLAFGWDGRVYSWGDNDYGQLGHGDQKWRGLPVPIEGVEGVRSIDAAGDHSLAVAQSGDVLRWGIAPTLDEKDLLRPVIVQGFGGARLQRVCSGGFATFAIGEAGEVFSWGDDEDGLLGHGDRQTQHSPKRVEALRGVRMSSIAAGDYHVLALAEDGLVYAWGENRGRATLGDPQVEVQLLPKLVAALRGVRIGIIAAAHDRSYAVADTGELWAWGYEREDLTPLGHGEDITWVLPKVVASLQGVKMDAVTTATGHHILALAEDGCVYAWGAPWAADAGALGLGQLREEGAAAHPGAACGV
jgi:alpha-tubulin suppressor-like RCC1 family protein